MSYPSSSALVVLIRWSEPHAIAPRRRGGHSARRDGTGVGNRHEPEKAKQNLAESESSGWTSRILMLERCRLRLIDNSASVRPGSRRGFRRRAIALRANKNISATVLRDPPAAANGVAV